MKKHNLLDDGDSGSSDSDSDNSLSKAQQRKKKEKFAFGKKNIGLNAEKSKKAKDNKAAKGPKGSKRQELFSKSSGAVDEDHEGADGLSGQAEKKIPVVGDINTLTVNKKFSADYEREKSKAALSKKNALEQMKLERAIARDASDGEMSDDSDATSEDDDGRQLNDAVQMRIFETLAAIKANDKSLYDPNVKFFDDVKSDDDGEDEGREANKKPRKADKKQTLSKTLAQQALAGGEFEDEGEGEADDWTKRKSRNLAHNSEQKAIKASFMQSVKAATTGGKQVGMGNADDEDDDDELFSKPSKVNALGVEADDGSRIDLGKQNKKVKKLKKKVLDQYFKSAGDANEEEEEDSVSGVAHEGGEAGGKKGGGKLSKNDKFLRDYVLNEWWRESDLTKVPSTATVLDAERSKVLEQEQAGYEISEDEEFLDKLDDFEAKYNFRFEEEGANEIMTYPRQIEDSVRVKDTRRKEQRDKVKERKAVEKQKKVEELKRLKAIKRKEINLRLKAIAKVSGLDEDHYQLEDEEDEDDKEGNGGGDGDGDGTAKPSKTMATKKDKNRPKKGVLSLQDLEGDFDPAEYDKRMAEIFNDDFYNGAGEGDDIGKPDVSDLLSSDDEDDENSEAAKGVFAPPEMEELSGLEKGGKRIKNKIKADGSVEEEANDGKNVELEKEKRFLQRQLEKLYKMDVDDISSMSAKKEVAATFKFRYREVPKASFGMTAEEILELPDKELNQRIGIKKLAPYRYDVDDKPWFQMKGKKHLLNKMVGAGKPGTGDGDVEDEDDDAGATKGPYRGKNWKGSQFASQSGKALNNKYSNNHQASSSHKSTEKSFGPRPFLQAGANKSFNKNFPDAKPFPHGDKPVSNKDQNGAKKRLNPSGNDGHAKKKVKL